LQSECKGNAFAELSKTISTLFLLKMKHFSNISTIIFDLGGVLINLDKERCVKAFSALGFDDIGRYLGHFQHTGLFIDLEKGFVTPEQFVSEVMKSCPKTTDKQQIIDAWCAFLLEIPVEKLHMLVELKKRFRIIMLSNSNAIHFSFIKQTQFEAQGFTLDMCFDKLYLSFEMGTAKPDDLIFEKLLANEGAPVNSFLFLDDGEKNIEKAAEMGIQTYHVAARENLDFLLLPQTWDTAE
jgi:glucose-1-phosphatase